MRSPSTRVTMARLVSGERPSVALALALAVGGRDLQHLDVEDRLDGLADLDLVGVGVDLEGVGPLVEEVVRLLAHHRLEDHVAWLHQAPSSTAVGWGRVASVKTTQS